jgi:hypothetical protein
MRSTVIFVLSVTNQNLILLIWLDRKNLESYMVFLEIFESQMSFHKHATRRKAKSLPTAGGQFAMLGKLMTSFLVLTPRGGGTFAHVLHPSPISLHINKPPTGSHYIMPT